MDRGLCCEKFLRDFVARTFALIALVRPVLHLVSCSNEMVPNAPKHYKMHQNMSLGSNVWFWCLRCKKFRRDFVARTFALIAPIRQDLNRVSCSNEMVPNAPKHYETLQNMSLGFNGMDRIPLLPKIPTQLRCTNMCSASFATSFME